MGTVLETAEDKPTWSVRGFPQQEVGKDLLISGQVQRVPAEICHGIVSCFGHYFSLLTLQFNEVRVEIRQLILSYNTVLVSIDDPE